MLKKLKKHYLIFIIPALILFLLFGLAKVFELFFAGQFTIPSFFAVFFFVISSITAIAGPLFLRTLFAHTMRNEKQVSVNNFLKFEKRLICISMLTPYFALIAVICEFEKFYFTGIIIMSLYAVYYYFPSKKRIDFDKKIFRINE